MGGKKVKLCQTAKLSARRSMRFDDFYWQSDFVIIFYFEAKYFFLMLRYKTVWSYHKQHLCLVSRPDKHFSGLTPTLSLSYWAIYSNKYITYSIIDNIVHIVLHVCNIKRWKHLYSFKSQTETASTIQPVEVTVMKRERGRRGVGGGRGGGGGGGEFRGRGELERRGELGGKW